MGKIKWFMMVMLVLFFVATGFSLKVYSDQLNILGPGDELGFSISNYSGDESKKEKITLSIYKMDDCLEFVSRDMPVDEANRIIKTDPVFSYTIETESSWQRESIPASFFPEIGSYLVVFWTSDEDTYCCVERTDTTGIALDFGDYVQLEVWDSMSGKMSEFGDILTGKQKVHLGSLNNPDARRIDKKDIQDELIVISAPTGIAIVSVDFENYIEKYNTEMVFLSERPIYRPGDTIKAKGYLYDRKCSAFLGTGTVTITMTDPMGTELFETNVETDQYGGFEISYETSEDAVRGHYDVVIDTGERSFYRYIEVSDYKKPTFTVDVSNIKDVYGIGEKPVFNVQADYYYGQSIDKGIVHTTVNLLPDYSSEYETKTLDIRSKTMENGHATDTIRIKAEGIEEYSVEFNVVDKSGREVSEHVYFKYVPSDIVIKTSEWKYWHNQNEGRVFGDFYVEPVYEGVDVSNRELELEVVLKKNSVYNQTVRTDSEGKFHFDFDPFIPGYYRLNIVDTKYPENKIGKSFFVYNSDYRYSTSERLELIRDKEIYKAGDFVDLNLLSVFKELNAFVIVDFGSSMITRRLKIKDNMSDMFFVIPEDVSRDKIRVHIFSYYGGEEISKIYDIPVNIERFKMNCDLKVPEKVKPGEAINVDVSLSDNTGKPLNGIVTLNIVDQALIDLYGDDDWEVVLSGLSRPPYNYFVEYFNRYYNFARLFSFNELEYEDANTLAQTKRVASNNGVKVRSDFSDSALWIPGVVVDGNYMFEMKLPENLTTWRTRAVAIADEGRRAYSAEKFVSTLPVTVNSIFPKFLISGDIIDLGMNVGNYSGEDLSFEIIFKAKGVEEIRQVEIKDKTNDVFWFEYKVPVMDEGEKINVELSAIAGKDGEVITEFSDSMEEEIVVNRREYEINKGQAGIITREKADYSYQSEVNSTVTLTMSADLESELVDTLAYLIGYPYGCTEQTISSFLPSLAFMELKKDEVLSDEDKKLFAEVPAITEASLKKLYSYQNYEGAWGWWKGGDTDQFMTAYVMYTYYKLNQLGYEINQSSFERGKEAIKRLMDDTDERLPFAEYVTALLHPSYSMLLTNRESLSSKLFLALLLAERGQDEVAKNLLEELIEEGSSFSSQFKVNFDNTTYFINDLQMNALLFDLMNKLEYNGFEMVWLFNHLYNNKTGAYWSSTKDSAFVVMALSSYISNAADFEYKIVNNMIQSKADEMNTDDLSITGMLKAGEKQSWQFTLSASEILNLDITGQSGLMWKVEATGLWDPLEVETAGDLISREFTVKKQMKLVEKDNSVSYRELYVPLNGGIIVEGAYAEGVDIDIDYEPARINGFRLEQIEGNKYSRRLFVNGKDTGLIVQRDAKLIGMTATSLTFDGNTFYYDGENEWTFVFRENPTMLRVGDEIRTVIAIDLPVEWKWVALEEYLPSCFVQDEDYGYDYYSGKYYATRTYLMSYRTSNVENRYDRTTAFLSYIEDKASIYMNNYKIIASGEFVIPPLKMFEMYNPANDICVPGMIIKVEK